MPSKRSFWRKRSQRSDQREPESRNEHTILAGDKGATDQQRDPPTETFPDGAEVLYDCNDASLDVCFVHGLTGDRNTTWTAKGKSQSWPKELLPTKLKRARIITYGYDAYVIRNAVASGNTLSNHAKNLLNDLTNLREETESTSRPLIFIAHSLGGLVVKDAILISRNSPEPHLQGICDYTKGIAFMGTPHRGSWMSDWSNIPSKFLGVFKSMNKSLLEVLQTDNYYLKSVQDNFCGMIRAREKTPRVIQVKCFFEELPLPVFGKVVPEASATLDGHNGVSIHADHSHMVKFASVDETGFKRLWGELRRWQSNIDSSKNEPALSEVYLACLRSLAFPEMNDRFHDIGKQATDTCTWVLEHNEYRKWKVSSRAMLCIKGKPGAGKSTLLRFLLDNAMHTFGNTETLVLSYFFLDRGTELQKTSLGLYRGLLHQFKRVPSALSDVVKEFETQKNTIGTPGEQWEWNLNELRTFFTSALKKALETRSVLLFIDALDECNISEARRLVEEFRVLLKTTSSTTVGELRACFSCRHYPVIVPDATVAPDPSADSDAVFVIQVEEGNEPDIRRYVQQKLSSTWTRMPAEITQSIAKSANGVFLWARLVTESILTLKIEGADLTKIKSEIHAIPTELDSLYQKLIQKMTPESLKLIQWICFAMEPLGLDELRWALLVQPDLPIKRLQDYEKLGDYSSDMETLKRRIQTLSCGLVEVTSGPLTVHFIHQTVKTFFTEKGLSFMVGANGENAARNEAEMEGMIHRQLSRVCICYILADELHRNRHNQSRYYDFELQRDFPLLFYARKGWGWHAKASEEKGISQTDLLDYFGWPSEALVRNLVALCIADHKTGVAYNPGATIVHILSFHGLIGPLTAVLQTPGQGSLVHTEDAEGHTALSYAFLQDQDEAVQLLLENGADGETESFRRVKFYMFYLGYLRDSRDDPWCREQFRSSWRAEAGLSSWSSLLLLMVSHIRYDAAKALLESNTTRQDGKAEQTLAARNWQSDTNKLLLGNNANINFADSEGNTPLMAAAKEPYNSDMVKLVLANGALVNVANRSGSTPLIFAARMGYIDTIKLLLDSGALVNVANSSGFTPLILAVEARWSDTAASLLDSGALVNMREVDADEAFMAAVTVGRNDVIKLLLARGARINDADISGRTALMRAVQIKAYDTVKLLLDNNAEVNATDGKGRSALAFAAEIQGDQIKELLLAHGARHATSEIYHIEFTFSTKEDSEVA